MRNSITPPLHHAGIPLHKGAALTSSRLYRCLQRGKIGGSHLDPPMLGLWQNKGLNRKCVRCCSLNEIEPWETQRNLRPTQTVTCSPDTLLPWQDLKAVSFEVNAICSLQLLVCNLTVSCGLWVHGELPRCSPGCFLLWFIFTLFFLRLYIYQQNFVQKQVTQFLVAKQHLQTGCKNRNQKQKQAIEIVVEKNTNSGGINH